MEVVNETELDIMWIIEMRYCDDFCLDNRGEGRRRVLLGGVRGPVRLRALQHDLRGPGRRREGRQGATQGKQKTLRI